jgi:hypothetical protein
MRREVEASTSLRSTFEEAAEVLRDDPGAVVVARPTGEQRREGRFVSVLTLPVGGGGGGLQHEIELRTEPVRIEGDGLALPLRWHATGHERRYPTFEGELTVRSAPAGTTLGLRGEYQVPFGAAGWVGDSVGGHHFAQRSLAMFLEDAACRLDAEVDRRGSAESPADASYVIDLREVGSENYLG